MRTPNRIPARRGAAFTLVETLVAASMAAAFMTAAVLAYSAFATNDLNGRAVGDVTVGSETLENLFGADAPAGDDGEIMGVREQIPWAPNYAKSAELGVLRDIFFEDVRNASAVFCLAREGANTATFGALLPLLSTVDARTLDTPAAFADYIETQAPGVFTGFRGVPPAAARNGTIFVFRPSSIANTVALRSVFDIDFVTTTEPAGTYVAIRRYEGGSLTYPYEIFYPAGSGTQGFGPLFVAFERRARLANAETAYDRFKKAAGRPFYFVWWPDPTERHLEPFPSGSAPTYTAGVDPRHDYLGMTARTAYFFVVPMFPAL
ncbi:hypothetical protein BH23VER1_BH23VER1_06320 [soil metagenome]